MLPIHRSAWRLVLVLALAAGALPGRVAAQPSPAAPSPGERSAVVHLVVESFATTAVAAEAAQALAVRRVQDVLSGLGVTAERVELRSAGLVPEYAAPDPVPLGPRPAARRLLGYRALSALAVTVPEPVRLGLLIDLAEGAGARLQEVWLP